MEVIVAEHVMEDGGRPSTAITQYFCAQALADGRYSADRVMMLRVEEDVTGTGNGEGVCASRSDACVKVHLSRSIPRAGAPIGSCRDSRYLTMDLTHMLADI